MVDEEFRNSIEQTCALFNEPAFDNSIIGFTLNGNIIYDFNAMIHELVIDEGWSDEEAQAFIEKNTVGMLPYMSEETRPVIMYFREDI